jgi:SAM-dependent methyltransferase
MKPICHLCEKELREHLSHVQDPDTQEMFSILQCDHCKLEQTWPQPSDLSPYYSQYHGGRHGFTANYCVSRRLSWIQKLTQSKKGKLLDIGCGDGNFLLRAAKEGWQVVGVETNPNLALAAGLNVKKYLSEVHSLGLFDCITLWHSLEHMPYPKKVLEEIRTLLKPNGLLVIAVPNAKGWQARFFGKKWLHRDVPRHLYHFDPHSLHYLLQLNEMIQIKKWHQEFEFDLLGWSQSALNYLYSSPNIFFKLLTGHLKEKNFFKKIFHLLSGVLISGLALPLVPLSTLAGQGGTLIIAARHQNSMVASKASSKE